MTEYREECPICGDEHDANLHGDALVIRDWSVRDSVSMADAALQDAMFLFGGVTEHAASFQKVSELYDERNTWPDDADAPISDGGCSVSEACDELLTDLETILSDAGYFAYSDGDAGCWFVFGPARDPSARIIEVR